MGGLDGSEVALILVVVAFAGDDRFEVPILWVSCREGDLCGLGELVNEAAEDTILSAVLLAAEILSRATCVTGAAFEPRGHVLPYQLL